MANDSILQKPPRLLSVEQGAYDWREFDRWIRRIYDLLAVRANSSSYSVVDEIDAIRTIGYTTSASSSTANVVDHPAELATVLTMGGATTSSAPADYADMGAVHSLGGTSTSTAVTNQDDFLTLYWMGV